MADVTEAAGVAKGAIYLYLDSKSAQLTALRTRYTSQWLEQPGRLDGPPGRGGYARQLRSFLAEMYDFHAANQQLHHKRFCRSAACEASGGRSATVGTAAPRPQQRHTDR